MTGKACMAYQSGLAVSSTVRRLLVAVLLPPLNKPSVVAPDDVIRDIGCLGIVEKETHTVLLVTFHFTGKFFEVSHRTVQNGSLPHSVDAGEDVHIGTQIPSYIKAFP